MRRIRLIRGMGFFDSVMLGIGFIIGSGIFIMPLIAAEISGTYSIIAWVLGGIYQVITGLCFAECAIKIRKAGGLYTYAHKAFGDMVGFFAGWTFWIGYLITIAAEQWALGWYLQFFLPQVLLLIRVSIGVLTGLVLAYLNFRGVSIGGKIGDWLTVGKLFALILFIVGAALFFRIINFYPLLPASSAGITGTTALLTAIGASTIVVLYAYLGEEIITVPDDEIKNAKKTVPKAVLISAISTMVIYVIAVAAFLGASRWTNFVSSQSPLSDLFTAVTHSQLGGIIITIGGLISIIGALNAVILGTARISFAMSRDKLFPQIFSRVHPIHNTPYMALLIQTVLALILSYTVTNFVALAALAVMFTLIPYALTSFATFKLIKKGGGELSILRFRGTPIIAGIASIVLIFVYLSQTLVLEIAAIILFLGLLVFVERKKIRRL
jgi:APA family basic amino acid/polyamine antiporter